MNKKGRWAAIVGVVCGAELVAVAIIGGAGIAALVSIEAAIVVALLGAAGIWIVLDQRRRASTSSSSSARSSVDAAGACAARPTVPFCAVMSTPVGRVGTRCCPG